MESLLTFMSLVSNGNGSISNTTSEHDLNIGGVNLPGSDFPVPDIVSLLNLIGGVRQISVIFSPETNDKITKILKPLVLPVTLNAYQTPVK